MAKSSRSYPYVNSSSDPARDNIQNTVGDNTFLALSDMIHCTRMRAEKKH